MTALPPAGDGASDIRVRRVGGSRRAVRPGAAGADPAPQERTEAVMAAEDSEVAWGSPGSNDTDDQLKRDVPPHWG